MKDLLPKASIDGLYVFDQVGVSMEEHMLVISQPMRSGFYSICLVSQGKLSLSINFKEYELGTDCLMVGSPSSFIHLTACRQETILSTVLFSDDFLEKLGFNSFDRHSIEFAYQNWDRITQLNPEHAERMVNSLRHLESKLLSNYSESQKFNIVKHTFIAFLYEFLDIIRQYSALHQIKRHMSRQRELLVKFSSLVSIHCRTQRKLKFYAEKLGITPKYLGEVCKKLTGSNAGALLDQAMLNEGKMLLLDASLSIGQIAAVLNFPDTSTFVRFFKRLTDTTPKAYREKFSSENKTFKQQNTPI